MMYQQGRGTAAASNGLISLNLSAYNNGTVQQQGFSPPDGVRSGNFRGKILMQIYESHILNVTASSIMVFQIFHC